MKIFTLEKQQQINRPLREVFQFFENPENLLKITPKWLNLRVLTPTPIQMRLGMIIDYTVKPLLFEDRWTTMITHYEAPYKFVDEQLKGPYSFWHHTHLFDENQNGTLITDIVRYGLPFGAIGEMMQGLMVRKQLEEIFHYRSRVIETLF